MTDTITKFVIKRRDSNVAFDVRKLVTNVKWTTDMNYNAGELDFELVEVNDGFAVHNGDIVMFDWAGKQIFKGYVFKSELKKGQSYTVTAYDGLRYFKSNDSIAFDVSTLGQRFDRICKYLNLKHKAIKTPKHKLKSELCDNKTYFSMLQDDIKKTYTATGERYFLRDNYGTIELRQYPHYQLNTVLGDGSLITDYTLIQSIDQTANVVKVVKSSSKKGKTSMSTESAKGNSIKKWGKLIHIETATGKLNDAQMKKLAKDTLKKMNRQTTKLNITAIGNIYFQAGNAVMVNVNDLKEVGIGKKRYLIRRATHTFGTDYHVELEMEW